MANAKAKSRPSVSKPSNAPDLGDWPLFLERGRKAVRTIRNYVKLARLASEIVGAPVTEWTRAHVRELLLSDTWGGYKEPTRGCMRAALKSLWTFTEQTDLLAFAEFWQAAPERQGRYKWLQAHTVPQADADMVATHCRERVMTSPSDDEVFRCFAAYLLIQHGLRCECLTSIRVRDINLGAMSLYIPRSKGGRDREIPLDQAIPAMWSRFEGARRRIIEHLERPHAPPEEREHIARLKSPEGLLVFVRTPKTSHIGAALPRNTTASIVRKLSASLTGHCHSPHAYRHARVFYLLNERRWPIHTVAHYMGHASQQTTFDYCPPSLEEMRRADGQAPTAPAPTTTPQALNHQDDLAKLKDLRDRGVLDQEGYTSALERLITNG